MSAESIYLAVVLAAALVSFYLQKVRTDVTALLVMISLIVPWRPTEQGLVAILTPAEAFHGFGSPALIMVASMFVLSAAMVRTGAAQLVGSRLLQVGSRTELSLQLTVLGVITLFSAVVNDTTTVLVWMPLAMAVCQQRGYAPGRVLILLAYASLLGGQWTLIGTRSNVILSDYLRARTGEGLGFFGFTPIAVAVWIACGLWFLLVGRRMLPARQAEASLESRYEVTEFLTETMAQADSELIGKTLDELDLARKHEVTVLQVLRERVSLPPDGWLKIESGDVLVVQGRITRITELLTTAGLKVREEFRLDDKTLRSADLRMVEAILPPDSDFQGRSLRSLDFHREYGVSPLAIGRAGQSIVEAPLSEPLRVGDSLLLVGHEAELQRLRANPHLMLVESRDLPPVGRGKAIAVLALMSAMVLCCATGLLIPAVAIPVAALAAVLTGCVGMRGAYESMDLPALVIVGAMIPFGHALQTTGSAERLAETVAGTMAGGSPWLLFAVLMLLSVGLTQLIENAAVAVILSPIAYQLAVAAGCDPRPFLLGVAICVSSAFMTPMAHESTILVMGAGRYRFRDYLLLGTPFALITWLVTSLLTPLLYPF